MFYPDRFSPPRHPPLDSPLPQASQGATAEVAALARLWRAGRFAELAEAATEALSRHPGVPDLWRLLAAAGQGLGQPEITAAAAQMLIRLCPDRAEGWINLGTALRAQGETRAARRALEQARALAPEDADAAYNLGNLLRETGEPAAAVTQYRAALAARPDFLPALVNLAVAERASGLAEAAVITARAALGQAPDRADLRIGLGAALMDCGDFAAARDLHDTALAQAPDHAEARWNRALCALALGDFSTGWHDYEARWRVPRFPSRPYCGPLPRWDGNPDARLLVWAEQGIGDEILFASVLAELAPRCATLTVSLDPRLIPLFSRSLPPQIRLIARNTPPDEGDHDAQIALGSACGHLRPDPSSFGATAPGWLRADPARIAALRPAPGRQRIGVSWLSHNPQRGIARSIAPERLIAALPPEAELIDLQYDATEETRAAISAATGRTLLRPRGIDARGDLDGLAALIAGCDAVVSIDNSTVHLAGALGVPTHVLLPRGADWRWGTDPARTLWYDALRLYRQSQEGDWSGPLASLAKTLGDGDA